MKKSIGVLGALAALLAFGAATTLPMDNNMYATIDNVKIILSPNWNLNAGGKAVFVSQPQGADRDTTGEFQAALVCTHGTFNKTAPDMVALGTALQANMSKQETGYTIVEKPVAVTIGGLKGVKFGGTFKRAGALVRDREYILLIGATTEFYQLAFTSLSSKWAAYEPLADKSMTSFSLKAGPASAPAATTKASTTASTTTKKYPSTYTPPH